MNIRMSTDILTGILFLGVSIGAVTIIGTSYSLGTASRMGPGFFPLIVSIMLGGLGAILVARSLLSQTESVGNVDLRPLLLVLASTPVLRPRDRKPRPGGRRHRSRLRGTAGRP